MTIFNRPHDSGSGAPEEVGDVADGPQVASRRPGSALEVFVAFIRLGLTSFGGPVTHLGYFRAEFVERRRWLDETAYADLMSLCQFLPGPTSSKLGYSLGLMRAGYAGGLAAWVGFTLPSAVLLVLFAYGAGALTGTAAGEGLLHGLKLVAVAIVAQAVWGMARSLCPDRTRATIGLAAAILALCAPTSVGQICAIVLGGLLGAGLCRGVEESAPGPITHPVSRRVAVLALAAFFILLAVSFWPRGDAGVAFFNAFYRSGALVFGGGHVVLPLLNEAVVAPGWLSSETFLAGYGAAQAIPGPLFTFAAYLGAASSGPIGGLLGALVALVAIFLPGMLLQTAALPFWSAFQGQPGARAAMRGVNAAVVGVLGAALYSPVWTGAVMGPTDVAIALAGFLLLTVWRAQPLIVVVLTSATTVSLALLGLGS